MSAEGIVWNQDDSRAEIISHKIINKQKWFQIEKLFKNSLYVSVKYMFYEFNVDN